MSAQTTATIITIGDELLIGQVIDTNSAYIAQQLNKHGFAVKQRVAVGDTWNDIWQALETAEKQSQIVIITGGLGPTADDITKPLLCQYFGGTMVMHEPTLAHVTHIFEHILKRPMIERNRQQAMVPDVCKVLHNQRGTAPGMQFEKNGVYFFALPGVPHEMKGLIDSKVLPVITQTFPQQIIIHKTLLTAGIGESFLAELINDFEAQLPSFIKLAYLPNYGMVRLRLTANGTHERSIKEAIETQFATLQQLVAPYLVVNEDLSLQAVVGNLLLKKGRTMATAESCTGGYIAHLITAQSGASRYYKGSVVSYDNEVKQEVLSVRSDTLALHGAVSEPVVEEMATGILHLLNVDYAIAVSGIMGPDGGTPEKPVGTVWVAVASKKQTLTQKFHFRFDRQRNIDLTAVNALNMLRKLIIEG
ncbi:MAG TPA: competence/damage-inducible protein A [Chitinophagaceae bacterium]|nr:competence/damage-inducible protein A [Chitinophagaceae bacterium]